MQADLPQIATASGKPVVSTSTATIAQLKLLITGTSVQWKSCNRSVPFQPLIVTLFPQIISENARLRVLALFEGQPTPVANLQNRFAAANTPAPITPAGDFCLLVQQTV